MGGLCERCEYCRLPESCKCNARFELLGFGIKLKMKGCLVLGQPFLSFIISLGTFANE